MPRRRYDLDEVLAYAQRSERPTAAEIVEYFGLDVTPRAISKAINKYLGPRPKRPLAVAGDPMRRRIVAWMIESGLNEHYCGECAKWSAWPCSIRELRKDDNLGSLGFVCRNCVRAGDF